MLHNRTSIILISVLRWIIPSMLCLTVLSSTFSNPRGKDDVGWTSFTVLGGGKDCLTTSYAGAAVSSPTEEGQKCVPFPFYHNSPYYFWCFTMERSETGCVFSVLFYAALISYSIVLFTRVSSHIRFASLKFMLARNSVFSHLRYNPTSRSEVMSEDTNIIQTHSYHSPILWDTNTYYKSTSSGCISCTNITIPGSPART